MPMKNNKQVTEITRHKLSLVVKLSLLCSQFQDKSSIKCYIELDRIKSVKIGLYTDITYTRV